MGPITSENVSSMAEYIEIGCAADVSNELIPTMYVLS